MNLSPTVTTLYIRHAFAGMLKVLDRLNDENVNQRPEVWGTNSVAGLIVHCCELAPFWFECPGLGREVLRDREAEFEATATINELRALIDQATELTCELIMEFESGPTNLEHEVRGFLPGGEVSDVALALHVLEELFQHLGHMEVTADALLAEP